MLAEPYLQLKVDIYSQTDIEGLSLFWGIEHFRLLLLGTEFGVYTDHKALEAIFNNPKSKPPARIERWMLRLQVIYKKGTFNEADYLSRHPVANQPKTYSGRKNRTLLCEFHYQSHSAKVNDTQRNQRCDKG